MRIRHKIFIIVLFNNAFLCNYCYAKIVDCPPIVLKNIQYSSHDNYILAYDMQEKKELWRTELFIETFLDDVNVFLETDAQLNIACIEDVNSLEVVATDNRHRKYFLDAKDGSIRYKTKNGKVVTGDDTSYIYNVIQNIKSSLGVFYYLIIGLFFLFSYMFWRSKRNKSNS